MDLNLQLTLLVSSNFSGLICYWFTVNQDIHRVKDPLSALIVMLTEYDRSVTIVTNPERGFLNHQMTHFHRQVRVFSHASARKMYQIFAGRVRLKTCIALLFAQVYLRNVTPETNLTSVHSTFTLIATFAKKNKLDFVRLYTMSLPVVVKVSPNVIAQLLEKAVKQTDVVVLEPNYYAIVGAIQASPAKIN